MEKKILIAVDESFYSRQAIEYVARMGKILKNFNYVLLNVQPKISEFLLEDARTDGKTRNALKDVKEKNRESSNRILNDSKDIMLRLETEENRIETVSQQQFMGTTKTILNYAKQTICDAIVLGKRGMSSLAESFVGSITNSLLEHTNVTPVWGSGWRSKTFKDNVSHRWIRKRIAGR